MDKHLDIRNLMRMSYDIKSFKDTLLRPRQRMLFSKQARRIVALDESSPVCSQSSADEDYHDRVFMEKRAEKLLKWRFESEIDRRLILGVIDRNVKLEQNEEQDNVSAQLAINNETTPIEVSDSSESDDEVGNDKEVFDKAQKNIEARSMEEKQTHV